MTDKTPSSPETTSAAAPAAKKPSKPRKGKKIQSGAARSTLGYPKHPILKSLRIPQAVLENNAGKERTDRDAAKFAGVGWGGSTAVEISSALKYGLFQRPSPGSRANRYLSQHDAFTDDETEVERKSNEIVEEHFYDIDSMDELTTDQLETIDAVNFTDVLDEALK